MTWQHCRITAGVSDQTNLKIAANENLLSCSRTVVHKYGIESRAEKFRSHFKLVSLLISNICSYLKNNFQFVKRQIENYAKNSQ